MKNYVVSYDVKMGGTYSNARIIKHSRTIKAMSEADAIIEFFDGCPSHIRTRIFNIKATEV